MEGIKHLPRPVHSSLRSSVVLFDLTRIVEELVLNSLHAGASKVHLSIDIAACYVRVEDDGFGISRDGLVLLGERNASSKFQPLFEEQANMESWNFRGETLASLSDISLLEVTTKARGRPNGYRKVIKACKCLFLEIDDQRKDFGTTVILRDLFYNQPVRRKSMQSSSKKVLQSVKKCVLQTALVYPQVSFRVIDLERDFELLHTHSSPFPLALVTTGFGSDISSSLLKVDFSEGALKLSGYLSGPTDSFSTKVLQYVYINSRNISKCPIHKLLNTVATSSFYSTSRKGEVENQNAKRHKMNAYPAFILNLCCPQSSYELTFEPSKTTLEFKEWAPILSFTEKAVRQLWRMPAHFLQDVFNSGLSESSETLKKRDKGKHRPADGSKSTMTSSLGTSFRDIDIDFLADHEKQLRSPGDSPKDLDNIADYQRNNKYARLTGSSRLDMPFRADKSRDKHRKIVDLPGSANVCFTETKFFPFEENLFHEELDGSQLSKDTDHFLQIGGSEQPRELDHLLLKESLLIDDLKTGNLASSSSLSPSQRSLKNQPDTFQDGRKLFTSNKNDGILDDQCLHDFVVSPWINVDNCNIIPSKSLKNQLDIFRDERKFDDGTLDEAKRCWNDLDRRPWIDVETCSIAPLIMRRCSSSAALDMPSCDLVKYEIGRGNCHSHSLYQKTEQEFDVQPTVPEMHSRSQFTWSDAWKGEKLFHSYETEESFQCHGRFSNGEASDKLLKWNFDEGHIVDCTNIRIIDKNCFSPEGLCVASGNKTNHGQISSSVKREDAVNCLDIINHFSETECQSPCPSTQIDCEINNELKIRSDFLHHSSSKQSRSSSAPPHYRGRKKFSSLSSVASDGIRVLSSFHKTLDGSQSYPRCTERLEQSQHVQCTDAVEGSAADELDDLQVFVSKWSGEIQNNVESKLHNLVEYKCDILDISSGLLHLSSGSLVPQSISKDFLENAKVLHQLDNKFIPVISGGVLAIIDQHAADERIRLEELRHKVLSGDGKKIAYLDSVKELVMPEVYIQLLQNYAEQIESWGWICKVNAQDSGIFKKNINLLHRKPCSVSLTAVPCILGINLSEKDLMDFLEQLSETDGSSSMPPSVTRILNSKACRGAIMFGDSLLPSECSLIVEELKNTSLCFQCAHGRPTTVPIVNLESLHKQLAKLRLQNEKQSDEWHGLRHHKPSLERAKQRLESSSH